MNPTDLISQLQQQLTNSQNQCTYQTNLKNQEHTTANKLRADNAELRADLQEKTNLLNTSQRINYNAYQSAKRRENVLTEKNNEALATVKQVTESEKYVSTLLYDHIAQINRLEREIGEQKQNHLALIDQLENELADEKQIRQQVESIAQRNLESWQLDNVKSKELLTTARQNSVTITSRIENLKAGNADLETALAAETSSHEEIQDKVSDLEQRQFEYSIELKDQAMQISELERALSPLAKACDDLRYQVTDAEVTNVLQESRIDTLESEKRGLKKELTAHDDCHKILCEPFASRRGYEDYEAAKLLHRRYMNLRDENESLQESLNAELRRRWDLRYRFRDLQAEKVRINEANATLKKEVRKMKARDDVREEAHWEDLCFDRLFGQVLKEDLTLVQQLRAILRAKYP